MAETAEPCLLDLTPLGVGEDYFVAGFRYGGRDMSGRITREIDREMYPVAWYSSGMGRWLLFSESESFPSGTPRSPDGNDGD